MVDLTHAGAVLGSDKKLVFHADGCVCGAELRTEPPAATAQRSERSFIIEGLLQIPVQSGTTDNVSVFMAPN